jgi:signal transduction histidine kinase
MPDGGELTVGVVRTDEGNALISVADTGCGIPAERLDKIFDPFYTTRAVGEGTGLGLSLAYSIARQHSGNIEVDSAEGKGATFTVRLPVCAE